MLVMATSSSSLGSHASVGTTPSASSSSRSVSANGPVGHSGNSKPKVVKRRTATKAPSATGTSGEGGTATRRQKRLERNRESARLSRRRRKHYLEVLEERVSHLSIEMDHGRRQHAAEAVTKISARRQEVLEMTEKQLHSPQAVDHALRLLDTSLNRSNHEMMVVSTFFTQQLKSFSLAPHTKFIMWLTLQGDKFFRGGRAPSERLSAARIGERMLQSGNDKASPSHSMWPLVCNEVGLSYDQEERVRNYQRTLLQTPHTWLDRHTGRASGLVMHSLNLSVNAVANGIRQRDQLQQADLTPEQRIKLHIWARKNAERIRSKLAPRSKTLKHEGKKYNMSPSHHLAANLYILNNRLQEILKDFPKQAPLATSAALKKLSRRPSFESLGQHKDDEGSSKKQDLSRDISSGSLKRSASSLSMDGSEKSHPQQVSPEEGEKTAASLVEETIGFVKDIIPPIPPPQAPQIDLLPPQAMPAPATISPGNGEYAPSSVHMQYQHSPVPGERYHAPYAPPVSSAPGSFVLTQPMPMQGTYHFTPVVSSATIAQPHPQAVYAVPQVVVSGEQQPQPYYFQPVHPARSGSPQTSAPVPPPAPVPYQHPPQDPAPQPPSAPPLAQGTSSSQPPPPQATGQRSSHARSSSFLPPHLNIVPEEIFQGDGAEDFFISLMDDEEWAIGAGIDMDTTN